MPWKIFSESGKFAIHKMNEDGSKGDLVPPTYSDKAGAEAHMKALYANMPEGDKKMMAAERVYDAYVATAPGEPYRLLPFGQIKRAKGGPARNLTPEMAALFKLPHFQPPVKLGSHEDTTPAGGHIIGLEVRADGLYAIPQMTDKGAKAISEGDYKYHSPEIIWEDGAIENAITGEWITGPLIVGDALLHVPALGEAAALYTSQYSTGDAQMADETVMVPKGLLEQLTALFKPAPAPAQTPPAVPEEYKAAMQERDELKAQIEKIEADKLHTATVTKLTADLQGEKFNKEFDGKAAPEAAEILASLDEKAREWVMTRLSAMAKRIDYSKAGEIGSDGSNTITDPREALNAAVQSKIKEFKVSYQEALNMVKDEAPGLIEAYAAAKGAKPKGE